MPQPLVSIIVPIYKVEPYLRQCLDSIVNQTYTNLEIILVDDGSPDGCPQICDEYAARDKRIVVIHKENGGLSDARNAGLDICKGEYISFVDSDDWIVENCIELMVGLSQQKKFDIILSAHYNTFDDNHIELHPSPCPFGPMDSHTILFNLCKYNCTDLQSICGKLYKRDLLNNIRFPIGKLYEDMYTNFLVFIKSTKNIYLQEPLYVYRLHRDSIMGKTKSSIFSIEPLEIRYHYLKNHNEKKAAEQSLPALCWDFLYAFGKERSYFFNNSHLPSRKVAKIKFLALTKDFFSTKPPLNLKNILLFCFYLFPQLYLLYKKFSPFKIRNN